MLTTPNPPIILSTHTPIAPITLKVSDPPPMRVARESTKTTLANISRRNPINPRHVINHQTLSARFQVGSSSCIVFPIPERWHHAEVDKCGLFFSPLSKQQTQS